MREQCTQYSTILSINAPYGRQPNVLHLHPGRRRQDVQDGLADVCGLQAVAAVEDGLGLLGVVWEDAAGELCSHQTGTDGAHSDTAAAYFSSLN